MPVEEYRGSGKDGAKLLLQQKHTLSQSGYNMECSSVQVLHSL
jgi:hypothetical protein